jgi:hypothetical protein
MSTTAPNQNIFHGPFLQFVADNYDQPGTHRFNQYSTFAGITDKGFEIAVSNWNSKFGDSRGRVEFKKADYKHLAGQVVSNPFGWGNVQKNDIDYYLRAVRPEDRQYQLDEKR